jgi:peptidase E
MKRLILMGGRPWFAQDGGKKFVDVLFRYFPKEVKLAFCIFAQPESDWQETTKVNTEMFNKFGGKRTILYQTMTAKNFAEVSAWADIVYLPGGDTYVLKEKIQACGDIATLWDDKVVAGSSAGADLFCEGFAFLQDKTFGRGLGWVKASCIPHWRSKDFAGYTTKDWDWAEQESLRQLPDMPVLCLPESEFVELTVR